MKKALLRDYIYDRLYHPTLGYFCKPDFQIGEMKSPLPFKQMIGQDDYQKALMARYPKNAWLTPSEIFKPYYGMTIANYIFQAHKRYEQKGRKKKQINIVEVGAGLGSAAEAILYYFRSYETELYENMTYTVVELSEQLCKRCREKLAVQNKRMLDSKRIKVVNKDIANYKHEGKGQPYVLFFEVMDNLPHDKIILAGKQGQPDLQTMVDIDTSVEDLIPISDPMIIECFNYYKNTPKVTIDQKAPNLSTKLAQLFLRYYKHRKSKSSAIFLPTYLLQVLHRVHQNIPGAHLIMSDFDALHSIVQGENAPIVSVKGEKSDEKIDFPTYRVKRGSADIFFPTNFELVKTMYEGVTNQRGQYLKSHEFIKEFSREKWAETKSGYNPFKEDFMNTSFFLTKI